jgi:hypothetical protein
VFSGLARVGGGPRAWSVILKVLTATSGSPTRWNYPAPEALAYERGLLDDLPPGLEAPRCFGRAEHGGQHHLWLEDLGSDAMCWRLDDYGRAARALGRRRVLHRVLAAGGRVAQPAVASLLAGRGAAAVHELPRFRRHPLVQCMYPSDVLDRCCCGRIVKSSSMRLTDCPSAQPQRCIPSESLLEIGTTVRRRLGVCQPGSSRCQLAPLVTASVAFLGVARDRWRDLEQLAVEAYLCGLQDAGWRGASDQLRFGLVASSALRPGCVRLVLPALLDETAQPRVELVLGIPLCNRQAATLLILMN